MTPKYKTYQEAFDATVEHLATQKRAARSTHRSGCFYHMQDGRMCAVGCHIPKNHPAQATMGPINMVTNNFPDIKELLMINGNYDNNFWNALQSAHDNSSDVDELKDSLSNMANHFDLNCDKLNLITEWSY